MCIYIQIAKDAERSACSEQVVFLLEMYREKAFDETIVAVNKELSVCTAVCLAIRPDRDRFLSKLKVSKRDMAESLKIVSEWTTEGFKLFFEQLETEEAQGL